VTAIVAEEGAGRKEGLDLRAKDVASAAPTEPAAVAVLRLIRVTLANNVRSERERAGVSQLNLAEACGVERSTIRRIEKAEREPRISTLAAFSAALDVPLSSFLVGLSEQLVIAWEHAQDRGRYG